MGSSTDDHLGGLRSTDVKPAEVSCSRTTKGVGVKLTREEHVAVSVSEAGVDVFRPRHSVSTAESNRHLVDILLPVHEDICRERHTLSPSLGVCGAEARPAAIENQI